MPTGKYDDESSSPPTRRVISVVEFLTVRERPQSAAQIADGLALSRSTVGAILTALDSQGWVTRLADLTYQLGPALIAISDRARPALPRPAEINEELDRLADLLNCNVGLSTRHRRHLIVVAAALGRGGMLPGFGSGTRMPLSPPAGAALIAHADESAQQAWLARGRPQDAVRCSWFSERSGTWGSVCGAPAPKESKRLTSSSTW